MPLGTVEKVENKYIYVKMERQDMCGECHACEMLTDKKSCNLKCVSNLKCKAGERVEVSLENSTFLKATYIMYGLPFVGLVIGFLIGYLLQTYIMPQLGEILIAITALLGMGVMLAFIYIRDKKNAYKKYLPKIVAKVSAEAENV
ncbi:SoxR reducing system RseC family protein [Cellulosilyticum ruminicola]|uniref:SoxR reducing system RseC family protein n=1 Tax=Cellulosilyticum ruminicola TaxID=425254 RepID=UPI0006D06EB8|nr:SoxR reducing system RseC family protein [Cellulosilyticum ruminicola]